MKNKTQKNRCSKVPCGKCLRGCKQQMRRQKTGVIVISQINNVRNVKQA